MTPNYLMNSLKMSLEPHKIDLKSFNFQKQEVEIFF